ncbi:MAG TPA: hypothetical protein PLP50_16620 [Thermoanaerobaculia bacterium]|nr:hypothetical protein [Thermoanaerobaculia bacterium]HQN09882.1 hypothetical protein [Thermoanaerobaculia bacterium]HQP89102.1 hypothetical protein [Thermoanaerobaculia bacterium]
MHLTRWTKSLLSERARRHEAARWDAEAEVSALEAEIRDLRAKRFNAEVKARRHCRLAYTLRGLRDGGTA